MNASAAPVLFTVAEVASLLKVSEKTVRRRLNDGTLVRHSIGHLVRVDATSVMHQLAATPVAAESARRVSFVHPEQSQESPSSEEIRYKVYREPGRGFVIRYYAADGARHSHRVATCTVPEDASQEEAEGYATTWIAEHVSSSTKKARRRPIRAFGPTFREFAEDWFSGVLATRYPDHVRRKTSAKADKARLKKYAFGLIGDESIASFDGDHGLDLVEKVVGALPSTLSAGTRRQILQAIHRVLALAVYPARLLRAQPLPKGFVPNGTCSRAKSYLYPAEEVKLLACLEVPLLERLFYGLLVREGLRVGEALSLTWSDVDLEVGVLHLDENKTDDSRAWPLSSDVVEALRRWKKLLGKKVRAARPVLVAGDGATIDPFEAARSLRKHLRAAGVDRPQLFEESERRIALRAHDLRASFVTVNLALGKTEAWITDRTGHHSSQMIYEYKRGARTHADLNLGAFAPLHEVIPELNAVSATGSP